MTMWGFASRRDDDATPVMDSPKGTHGKRNKRRIGRRRGKKQSSPIKAVTPTTPTVSVRRTLEEQAGLNVSETGQGIEILLDWNTGKLESQNIATTPKPSSPMISLAAQIAQRQKVYRAQFSVFFPVLDKHKKAKPKFEEPSRRKNHRVPLGGRHLSDNISFNEIFYLLQSADVKDEITSVRVELKRMTAEIDALEENRDGLEKRWMEVRQSGNMFDPNDIENSEPVDWDIHRLLSTAKDKPNADEKKKLEAKRGLCLTLFFQNSRAEEVFLSKCGVKNGRSRSNKRKAPGTRITLDPDNCRAGGAGATVQHFSIMKGTGANSAFFLSRDSGKSFTWGHLPPKLFWRMKHHGMDPQNVDLVYLSTGPKGCYYAEFRSGERWWGCAGEDKDFHAILQEWDVYRVVFGSFATFSDEEGKEIFTSSWLILGRDGRAAWKNIPTRLHHLLECRLANSAAPAEVALGCGESYYVRFLDGTVDYCLPAGMASICEHIEKNGGTITDMALHPEMSHEFIVRHTEIS